MRLLINEKEKLPENDSPVIIEDGVGVEENVIILKGVTVERGSVIAAGCVANKSHYLFELSRYPGSDNTFTFYD